MVFGPKGLAEVRLSGPHHAEHSMDELQAAAGCSVPNFDAHSLPVHRQQRALARV